jgi:predicted transposase YdaD
MKWKRDYNSGIESARREAEAKGREEGRREGMRLGEEKGLEKGQYMTQAAMAEKMLKKGYNIETVSEFTGIPVSEKKFKLQRVSYDFGYIRIVKGSQIKMVVPI